MKRKVKKHIRRKKLNLAVKREFQMWLLVRILGVVIFSTMVAVFILYFFSRKEISSSFYTAHIQIRRVSDLLFPVMTAGALVSLLSGLILALFLPQKLAGPIYRIQKSLETIRDGDLTEHIELRKNDPFSDLADSVNQTAAGLRARIREIKEVDKAICALEHQEEEALAALQASALERLRTSRKEEDES
jgi:methyl-accepting chemotaxis protein